MPTPTASTTFSPILLYQPGGGVPPGSPATTPPVYSQADVTQLIQGQAYIDVVFGSVQTDDDWVLVACEVENTTDFEPLNIWPGIITDRTAAGFRIQLNGMPDSSNYYLRWAVSGINIAPVPATLYYLTGPASVAFGDDATFTVKLPPSTTLSGPLTVTPNDGGAGGTFSPTSVVLTGTSASQTFIYTAASYGAKTISVTNSGTLTDPASLVLNVVTDTYTLSGPGSGVTGVASTNFTVALPVGGAVAGTVTVTPHDGGGGGTFTPTTVALTTGVPSRTFTYTPASSGTKTISTTNNGGLTDPGSISYIVTTPPFAPTDIAGLKLWLKADALALSDGTAVGTWPDSSGLANDFTQATAGNKPVFKTAIVNGKPVVRFDGVNDYVSSTTAGLLPLPAGNHYTVFAVVYPSATAVGTIIAAGSATHAALIVAHDTTQWFMQQQTGGTGLNTFTFDGTFATGAWTYLTNDWDGANMHLWRNGTLKDTKAATNITGEGSTNSVGYALADAVYPWTGDIAEVLFYDSALGSTDRGNVELYLKTKYNL